MITARIATLQPVPSHYHNITFFVNFRCKICPNLNSFQLPHNIATYFKTNITDLILLCCSKDYQGPLLSLQQWLFLLPSMLRCQMCKASSRMINGRRWELCGRDREHHTPASCCQSLGMQLVRPNGSHIPLQRWHLKPLPWHPAVDTAGRPLPNSNLPQERNPQPRRCCCQK